MSELSTSLDSLIGRLRDVASAVDAATKSTRNESTTTASTTATPAISPVESAAPSIEKRVQITLDLPRTNRQETIVTDEKGADALARFLTDLRSELERS